MTSLESRVAALETTKFLDQVVVFIKSFAGGSEPMSASEIGGKRTWHRETTETSDQFRERVAAAARVDSFAACIVLKESGTPIT